MSERLKLKFRLELSMINMNSLAKKIVERKLNMMFHLQVRTSKHNSPTVLAEQEDTHPQGMPHHTQLLGSL